MYALPILPLADILFALRECNAAGRVIVLLLFVGSIYVWSIMVTKYAELKKAQSESYRFVSAFRKESHPVNLYLKRKKYGSSPLYRIYEQGCEAIGGELDPQGSDPDELFMGQVEQSEHRLSVTQFEAVRNSAERNLADQSMILEGNMGILATAVTASPFLGLLGTVWGVMDAFGGMAVTGTAQLSAVAPGIAGALLTTVIGLIVALPSAIGYNLLTSRIRELQVHTDNFAQEFMASVQRTFLHQD